LNPSELQLSISIQLNISCEYIYLMQTKKSHNLPDPHTWALQTTALGLSGALFGLTKSLLSSSPLRATLFVSAAYGANCTLVFGTLFGIRSIALHVVPSDVTSTSSISAFAGAVTGGAFTGVVSGLRKIPQGALLWGSGCFALQYFTDQGLEWRHARAEEIWMKRGRRPEDLPLADTTRREDPSDNSNTSFKSSKQFDESQSYKESADKMTGRENKNEVKPVNVSDDLFSNFFLWFPLYRTTFETDRQLLDRLRSREMDLERELGLRGAPAPDERVKHY
jgi:hypothetical protein